MKKALRILAGLVLLAVLALAVFIATFDADRYRPQLVTALAQAAGRPVTLEHVALGWRRGIALQLRGLTLHDQREDEPEPLLHVDAASALIRLLPLLRKDVQVSSVVLFQPRVHVSRDAQGRVNLMGLAAAAAPAAASHPSARPGAAPVSLSIDSFRIEGGSVHWTDAAATPRADVWLSKLDMTVKHIAPGRPMDFEVKGALGGDTPNVSVSGRLTPPAPYRTGTGQAGSCERLRLAIERLPLELIIPPGRPGEPHLRGILSATLQGSAATLEPSRVARAVSGSGQLTLNEPVITNLNILREVFEKISMIPGLLEALEARLPPDYQAKLAARNTVLEPMALSMQLDQGVMRFNEFSARTDTFGLSGSGSVGLDGAVNVQAVLRVAPAFSAALIRSVNELQALSDRHGELAIPLMIQGPAPRIAVLPDVTYLASKLLVTKVQDLLGTFLQKALEKNTPAEASPQP